MSRSPAAVRALVLASLAALLAGLLAGCAEDARAGRLEPAPWLYADTPVAQIREDAVAAMRDLASVHIAGNATRDGEVLRMDLAVSGSTCEGTIELAGSGQVRIRVVDGTTYFKADEEFWVSQGGAEAGAAARDLVGDRWATNSDEPDTSLQEMCDIEGLMADLGVADVADDDDTVVGTTEIDGIEVLKIAITDDSDGGHGHVYVAAAAPHHLVKMDMPGESTVVFNRFDEEVEVEAPAAADVFDFGGLGRRTT